MIMNEMYKNYSLIIVIICSILLGKGDREGKGNGGEVTPPTNEEFELQNRAGKYLVDQENKRIKTAQETSLKRLGLALETGDKENIKNVCRRYLGSWN